MVLDCALSISFILGLRVTLMLSSTSNETSDMIGRRSLLRLHAVSGVRGDSLDGPSLSLAMERSGSLSRENIAFLSPAALKNVNQNIGGISSACQSLNCSAQ